jgi:hypothetical protein
VPQTDHAVVQRIREAGFVVLGKTNTPEFGSIGMTESELNGDCRNPWDTTRTPGGSSGGAAAALASGLCPVAHGSDGGARSAFRRRAATCSASSPRAGECRPLRSARDPSDSARPGRSRAQCATRRRCST